MKDEEFEKHVETIRIHYEAWLDEQNNLLEQPLSEIMGNAFFDGYEKGLAEGRKEKETDIFR